MMGHRPPRVICRRWLRIPDVTGITGELSTLQGTDDGVAIADLAPRRIHQVGASFHLANERVVEQILCLWMQRRVDRDHVADAHHRFDIRITLAKSQHDEGKHDESVVTAKDALQLLGV